MRIGIIGLGLIGGSLGGALRSAGHFVTGHDRDPHSEHAALDGGFVDVIKPIGELASESDVVVLCTPISVVIEAIPEVTRWMKPNAILTDVASVKRPVISAMESTSLSPHSAGGHPIAGKETSGISYADSHLFEGAPYAIVRTRDCKSEVVSVLRDLARDIGADPVILDAVSHDEMVARTSHLPQVLSSALANCLQGANADPLKGPGLRGMLRLARSDETLWAEILSYNADNVTESIRAFTDALENLVTAISERNGPEIELIMRRAREATS